MQLQRIISNTLIINQQNALTYISIKTLKHLNTQNCSEMFRSCQIILRELCFFLLKVILKIFTIYKSYCRTVHFCRITSIYQPTNAHIIPHKTLLKHYDLFRSCQIIIRELCSFLKLYYSIHNSIGICKRGVVAAYL